MTECLSCGEKLTVVRSKKYEGFAVTGWEDKCIFCGTVVASSLDPVQDDTPAETPKDSAHDRLSALLGGDIDIAAPEIRAEKDEKRFCRICCHFLQHPFTPRCGLDNSPVDPMGDCVNFAAK